MKSRILLILLILVVLPFGAGAASEPSDFVCPQPEAQKLIERLSQRSLWLTVRMVVESEYRAEIMSQCFECKEKLGEAYKELMLAKLDPVGLASFAFVILHGPTLKHFQQRGTLSHMAIDSGYSFLKNRSWFAGAHKKLTRFALQFPKIAKGGRQLGAIGIFLVALGEAVDFYLEVEGAKENYLAYTPEGFLRRTGPSKERLLALVSLGENEFQKIQSKLLAETTFADESWAHLRRQFELAMRNQEDLYQDLKKDQYLNLQLDQVRSSTDSSFGIHEVEALTKYSKERTAVQVGELIRVIELLELTKMNCQLPMNSAQMRTASLKAQRAMEQAAEALGAQLVEGFEVPQSCVNDVENHCGDGKKPFTCLTEKSTVLAPSCVADLGFEETEVDTAAVSFGPNGPLN